MNDGLGINYSTAVAPIPLGIFWCLYVGLLGALSIILANRAFSISLEFLVGPRPQVIHSRKIHGMLAILGWIYEAIQTLVLCFSPSIPWNNLQLNLFLDGPVLVVFFFLSLVLYATFGLFFAFSTWPSLLKRYTKHKREQRTILKERDIELQMIEEESSLKLLTDEEQVERMNGAIEQSKTEGRKTSPVTRIERVRDTIKWLGCTLFFDWFLIPFVCLNFQNVPEVQWSALSSPSAFTCWSNYNLLLAVLSVCLMLFVLPLSYLWSIQRNAMDWDFLSRPSSGPIIVTYKALLASITVLLPSGWPHIIILFSLLLFNTGIRFFMPPIIGHQNQFNHIRGGILAGPLWGALMGVVVMGVNDSSFDALTIVFWVGLVPTMYLVFRISRWWENRRTPSMERLLDKMSYKDPPRKMRTVVHHLRRISILDRRRFDVYKSGRLRKFITLTALLNDDSIRWMAIDTMSNFVLNAENIGVYVLEDKLDMIIAMGIRATEDEERMKIARLLANLSSIDDTGEMVSNTPNTVEFVNLCLSSHDAKLREQVLRLILHISQFDHPLSKVLGLRVARHLVDVSHSCLPRTRRLAAQSFLNFAHRAIKEQKVEDRSILPWVKKMSVPTNEQDPEPQMTFSRRPMRPKAPSSQTLSPDSDWR
ncbi:hypothetical protein PROFUN_00597, partial [Planoprotostelium fungivorum]